MDPAVDELNAMKTIQDILNWAKVSGDPADKKTPRGAFLDYMGVTEDEHPRNFGAMPKNQFDDYTDKIKVDGNDPSPVLKTKLGLVGRVARILVGTEPSQDAQAAMDAAAYQAAQSAASVQAQIVLAQSQLAVPTGPAKRTIKMSLILDQANDTDVIIMDDVDLRAGYKRWHNIFKAMPSPDDDCTIEQLSGLAYFMKNGNPPWADFAIFGPHGQRLMCKLKMSGLRLQPDGTFLSVEYKGPPTYWLWEQCYSILRTCLIFLDAAELGPLEAYRERIKKYAMENPSEVWHLLYQAEHRMRKEHMERILRKGELLKAADVNHPFDPSAPWKWVWAEAASGEDKFWKKEFEDPAVLVITHTRKVGLSLDGDAALAGDRCMNDSDLLHTSGPIMPGIQTPPIRNGNPPPAPHGAERPAKRPKNERDGQDTKAVFSNGVYTSNKKGLDLCIGYQSGSCPATNHQGRCPKNTDRVHQCQYCLSAHSGCNCPKNGDGGGKKWGNGKKKGGKKGGKGRGKGD